MFPQDMHKFSQSCFRSLPAAGPPRGGSDRNASPGTPPPPEGAPQTPVMGVLARGWGACWWTLHPLLSDWGELTEFKVEPRLPCPHNSGGREATRIPRRSGHVPPGT